MQRLEQTPNSDAHAVSGVVPARARLAIVGGVAIVIAGALYLMAVRGEALLVDLSQFAGRVWCF
jgi:hypothetical protein